MLIRPLNGQNTAGVVVHSFVLSECTGSARRGIDGSKRSSSILRLKISVSDTSLASVAAVIVILTRDMIFVSTKKINRQDLNFNTC